MEQPLISVIIPAFNRALLIGDTLNSVIAQTYQNWECIIVDDGSADNTVSVLNEYCDKDSRITFYQRPEEYNKGGSGARNFGFKMSKGQYIQWLDSDEIILPSKLGKDIKNINSGEYDFTISQSGFFNELGVVPGEYWNENLWSSDALNDFIQKNIGWGINSPLWKKSMLDFNSIQFDENLYNGQDFLFHIQAIIKGLRPSINNEVLVLQRLHLNKIEHNVVKAHSKLVVFIFLLQNSSTVGLNDKTKSFLIRKSFTGICSLYKRKNWKGAVLFSSQLINWDLGLSFHLLKLFLIGSFYKLFSKGYNLIK